MEVLKYSHQIKILSVHTIPVPSIETHCNAVILNQGYMYSYKSTKLWITDGPVVNVGKDYTK